MIDRNRLSIALVITFALPSAEHASGQLLGPPATSEQIVMDATNVLGMTVAAPTGIPQKLVAEAQAIAIVPNMVRGAFVVGLQHGRGVLLVRDAAGGWQPPRMISITGGSIGYQIGVQSTDLILVFRTPQSVANLMNGTIKIGVDASAAAGPVGRQASAATDLPLEAEILSYSRARGAFIGVSIDGSSIALDGAADAFYYQPPGTVPTSAVQLIEMVTAYSGGGAALGPAQGGGQAHFAPKTPHDHRSDGARPVPNRWILQGAGELEAARQQLAAASQRLAMHLDDQWKRYLALPADVYVVNRVPSAQAIQEVVARYEEVSRRAEYGALATRPEFQETLGALLRLRELLGRVNQPLELPPPPK
jgi:SH3 domain-containing YSC84-like protein 1